MKAYSLIEDRLAVSLACEAIDGDSFERSVLADQIAEAIRELRRLRLAAALKEKP